MARVMSIATATRCAQFTVILMIIVGLLLISLQALHTARPQPGTDRTTTTTTDSDETATTETGTKVTRKHETITGFKNADFVEQTLGTAGLWILRALLVVLAAFLTGAAMQRTLLGEFALKVGGWLEVPQLPLREATEDSSAGFAILTSTLESKRVDLDFEVTTPASPQDITSLSYLPTILTKGLGTGAIDYTIIDLGTGQSWLTSRLFIFAILMRQMRALKTFVFVDSLGRIQDRFLGLAPPDTLRWALAREYPWLERAYAAAYSSTISNHQIRSDSGALDEVACATLVQHFISSTQARQNGGAGEWVELGPDETWEHASWVSSALLERLVSLSPTGSSIIDMGDLTPEQKTRAILARASPFVAIVDGNGSFKSLIDRQALLESLAAL